MSNSILARLAMMAILNDINSSESDDATDGQNCPCPRCTAQREESEPLTLFEFLRQESNKRKESKADSLQTIIERWTGGRDAVMSNIEKEELAPQENSFVREPGTNPKMTSPEFNHADAKRKATAWNRMRTPTDDVYPKFQRVIEESFDAKCYNALSIKLNRSVTLGQNIISSLVGVEAQLYRIESGILDIAGKQADTDDKINRILQLLESNEVPSEDESIETDDSPSLDTSDDTLPEDDYTIVDLRRKDRQTNPDEPRLAQFYVEEVANDQGTILPIRRLIKPKKTNKELKVFLEMLMNLSYQSYGTEVAVSGDIHKKITERNTSHTIKGTPQRVLITNSDEGVYVIVHDVNTYEVTNVFAQSSSGTDVKFRKLAILPETIKTFGKIPASLK